MNPNLTILQHKNREKMLYNSVFGYLHMIGYSQNSVAYWLVAVYSLLLCLINNQGGRNWFFQVTL